jgi:hypothetical protein
MKTSLPKYSTFLPFAFAALSACSGQVGTDYRGVPLLSLTGTVETSSSGAPVPQPVNAAIVWAQLHLDTTGKETGEPTLIGSWAPVQGAFPASFTLDIYEPPPAAALNAIDPSLTPHLAIGFITALDANADMSQVDPSAVAGGAKDFVVTYLDEDVPGSNDVASLGMQPTAGYHLLKSTPIVCDPGPVGSNVPCATHPFFEEVPERTPVTIQLGYNPFEGSSSSAPSAPGNAPDAGTLAPPPPPGSPDAGDLPDGH